MSPHIQNPTAPTLSASVTAKNQRNAIFLILIVSLVFSIQDGVTRYLGAFTPIPLMVMFRYWFMAAFVIALSARSKGGLRGALRTKHMGLQILRGLLLVAEILLITESFVRLGLVESHAVFIAHPLISVALAVLLLGEQVGWRRWLAVVIGFVGVLVILQPGAAMFSSTALLALAAAAIYALYGVLTRKVAKDDSPSVSFFWTGIVGAIATTFYGLPQWGPVAPIAWPYIAILCVTGVIAHGLMIRAYSMAEASSLQPFTYSQLIWAVLIGYFIFNERVGSNVIIGGLIIVSAGMFTLLRSRKKQLEKKAA